MRPNSVPFYIYTFQRNYLLNLREMCIFNFYIAQPDTPLNGYSSTSVARTLMVRLPRIYFEQVLESLTKNPTAAVLIVFGIISADFF